jgi:tRNA1(Val) A37 N6-methylase TrmN6
MIHRADALPQILQAAEGRLGDLRLKFIFGNPAKPAIRLLIAGRKGARGPLHILPQLALYDEAGARALAEKDIAMGRGLIDMAVKLGRPRQ